LEGPDTADIWLSIMLNDEEKAKLANRLHRIAGQVAAIERMVEEGNYCVDILMQISAVSGAVGRVGQIVLESHLRTCVADAMKNGNQRERDQKLNELIEIFRKYSHVVD
jgi:DNA-binding FrmR family transcriptional regulator